MTNNKDEIITQPYMAVFTNKLLIDETKRFLLDTISVYGLRKNCLIKRVDFKIKNKNGQNIIYPICPLSTYDSFLLYGQTISYINNDDKGILIDNKLIEKGIEKGIIKQL